MPKTIFVNGDPSQGIMGTMLKAEFLNALQNHRHDGRDADGSAPLDYAADTGAVNACEAAYNPAITTLVNGLSLLFKAGHNNTGPATFSPDGLPALPIYGMAHQALQGGEIAAGGVVVLQYNSTLNAGDGAWVLLFSGGASGLQVPDPTQSRHAVTKALLSLVAAAGKVPLGDVNGLIDPAWLGITTAPGISKVPKSGAGGKLDAGWLDFTSSYGGAGYQKLPNGFVIQWGSITASTSGAVGSFPVAFPNSALAFVAWIMAGDSPSLVNNGFIGGGIISNAQYRVFCGSGSPASQWIAVGC